MMSITHTCVRHNPEIVYLKCYVLYVWTCLQQVWLPKRYMVCVFIFSFLRPCHPHHYNPHSISMADMPP